MPTFTSALCRRWAPMDSAAFMNAKSHFLQSVPYALKNVRWLLDHVHLPIELPTLMGTFSSMVASEKFQSPPPPPEGENLTVRIMSFSFHRGMPKDETGHGGGFVFDARSLPNPGREERFKTATGKDEPVIEYLNQQESVRQFLASVLSLVDASVSNYQERRFKSLMVSFGCTGGQHRSVYLAERLATTFARQERGGGLGAASRVGEHGQMKAMILAAGLGTRLRPLTDNRPKALVEIDGHTLLEISLSRLREFGIRDVIINVHHFADMILDYLKANANFGMRIEVSREEKLLDTGGGLKKAAHFFVEDCRSLDDPFILHNVDVISTIDLGAWCNFIRNIRPLPRWRCRTGRLRDTYFSTSNFSFVAGDQGPSHNTELVRTSQRVQALAFSGIHVISPRFLAMMTEEGAFSIITSYLRLAAQQEQILAFRADEYYWRDLGRPEDLEQAAQDAKQKIVL